MSEPTEGYSSSHGAAWAALIIGIIALILTVIIYIVYFLEREDALRVFEPVWTVAAVGTDKTIAGQNFTLYSIPNTLANDTLTLNKPADIKQGQWFVVSNTADKSVKVTAGSGVTFQSFPTTSTGTVNPPPLNTESVLPSKQSWIVAWADGTGTALNLVPGGHKQS